MASRPLIALVLAACAALACSKSSAQQPPAGETPAGETPVVPAAAAKPVPPAVQPGPGDDVVVDDRAAAPDELASDGSRKRGYREQMKQFDTDGDGRLSDDERYTMLASRATAVLDRMDTDRDGQLSRAELDASPGARRVGDFAAADLDKSGTLSSDELGTAMVEQLKKAGGFRAWRGLRGAGSGGGGE